jgi:hypothetical protein
MRRGFWFLAGAGAGIYAVVRGRRAAEILTTEGLRDRLGALDVGARIFRDEFADAQAAKETELRERFGLVPHGRPQLTARDGLEAGPAGSPEPPKTTEGDD